MAAGFGVFVINLPRAVERRAWISAHLRERGLADFVIVDGVEGAKIPATELPALYDEERGRRRAGRRFTAGEIGCALSHVAACRQLLAGDLQWALVLEDDALLAADAPAVIAAAADWLAGDQPRVLLLSPLTGFLRRPSNALLGEYRVVRVHRAWNAHGYALNRAAAQRMAAENSPVHLMADDWVAYRRACGLEIRGVDPYCIDVNDVAAPSLLEDERARRRKQERTIGFRLRTLGDRLRRHLIELLWLRPVHGIGRHKPGRLVPRG